MRISPALTALLLASLGMAQAARADTADAEQWIVLEADGAKADGARLVWDFQLNRPWEYYVQAIHTGESTASVTTLNVAGQQFSEPLSKSFVIEAGIMSQFKRSVTFERDGRHTLSIETDATRGWSNPVTSFPAEGD